MAESIATNRNVWALGLGLLGVLVSSNFGDYTGVMQTGGVVLGVLGLYGLMKGKK